MPRFLLFLLSLALAPGLAFAHDGDRQLCDGKYALAQEMLDAAYGKYGTIYSGGFDGSSYGGNGVGPTIDLWRLWRGLPDLRFRDASTFNYRNDWGWDFSGFGQTSEDFAIILRIAEREKATGLSEVWRYITAIFLNRLVSAGSGPGWWLAPTSRDATEHKKLVIEAATPGSLMEWLLVVQADSDTPDSVAWVRDGEWEQTYRYPYGTKSPRALVQDLVTERRVAGSSLEWVAAAYVTEGSHAGYQNVHVNMIRDCSASQAEYALGAVEAYEYLKREGMWGGTDLDRLQLLPEQMRLSAMSNLGLQAVRRIGQTWDSERAWDSEKAFEVLAELAALSPSPEFASWLFVGRAWTAGSIDQLIAFHDGAKLEERSVDTLNLLALDHLIAFAEQATLPADQRRTLVRVIAARAFVQGRLDIARRHLAQYQMLSPNEASAIEEALIGPGSDDVQVARALLVLPTPTVRLSSYESEGVRLHASWPAYLRDIDLPLRFFSAAVLNRDLRWWMKTPPYPNSYQLAERALRRGRIYDDPYDLPFIPEEWSRGVGFPFLRLIAWNEISQLDVCHGLTNRLSEVLVAWVDQSSDTWFERVFMDTGHLSETLRRIIILNKYSPGALVDGKPAGQRAFALLSSRFAGTEAAKTTRYWYFKDLGCRE